MDRTMDLPGKDYLEDDRVTPIAVGVGLLAVGALLWKTKPSMLDMPDPLPLGKEPDNSFSRRALRKTRDGVSHVAPSNLSVSLGRSMVIGGLALVLTRILDELTGKED